MARSLTESLERVAPPLPASEVMETIDDLARILSLPKRSPVNCERDRKTHRYPPETEALIRVETAKYSRGKRLSCACRPRVIRKTDDGLLIFRVLPERVKPEAPLLVSVEAFARDHQASAVEMTLARQVAKLRVGEEIQVPAADGGIGHFCIEELNAVQAWTLREAVQEGGILGFQKVGSGKSACCLLAPLAFPDCQLAVLLFESNQRAHYRSQYLRIREHFKTPSIIFDDGSGYTVPGTPPLHLVTYSKIGHPSSPDILGQLRPGLLACDEAHRLAGEAFSTGRRRVRRYFKERIAEREADLALGKKVRPRAVNAIFMSGTLEDKSVKDTQPLGAFALGTNSPLPLDTNEAENWSQVMDPLKQPDRTSPTARKLQQAFGGVIYTSSIDNLLATGPEEAIRKGFQKRRVETPGVISANISLVSASLYFKEKKAPPLPVAVKEALEKVRKESIRPDGDIIVEQTMQKQIAREVASGWFYFWAFPKIKCDCNGMGDCDGCLLIDQWFMDRKLYGKELRVRLLDSEIHLDSPKMCMNAAMRAEEDTSHPSSSEEYDVYCVNCRGRWPCGKSSHLPAWRSEHWKAWGEIKDKVPHEQRVKWIDDFLAKDAADWALNHRGVLWYQSVAFGERVAQIAKLSCHGGGPDAEAAIRAETGKRSVIASLRAHGKGLDGLQLKFSEQLFTEMPSSNRIMEQALGRLVRTGQSSDCVRSEYYAHVEESREALRKVLERAEFNQAMTGNAALILCADFEDRV